MRIWINGSIALQKTQPFWVSILKFGGVNPPDCFPPNISTTRRLKRVPKTTHEKVIWRVLEG